MSRLRAGNLRKRVIIQTRTASQDSLGGNVLSWSNGETRYASIEQLTAEERMAYDQREATSVVRITLRYYAGISPKDRVLWGSRVFNIRSVNQMEERNHVTTLIAVEDFQ